MTTETMSDAATEPIDVESASSASGRSLGELVLEHGGLLFDLQDASPVDPDDPRADVRPGDVHLHSGRVATGDLFAGLPGLRVDGATFVPEAIRRGAAAVLLPADRPVDALAARCRSNGIHGRGALAWVHPRAASVVGEIANSVHGDAASEIDLVAVTGTNGKTSVAHLTAQLLGRAERACAIIGTAGHTILGAEGPIHLSAGHTTPDVTETVRLLARHGVNGGDAAVMEASSHALVQGRLAGLRLRAAAFTNLTREHLDFHGTMEAYFDAKAKLWDHVEPGGTAVIFGHTDAAEGMRAIAADRGLRVLRVDVERDADLVARDLVFDDRGVRFEMVGAGLAPRRVRVPFSEDHNVENALVAVGLARALGMPSIPLVEALPRIACPPGRLESIHLPRGFDGDELDVFVDYAHSPDALARVLATVRRDADRRGRGRLLCVFGCGGDRDRGKRAEMGRAVGSIADVAIVTSDNPRSVEPSKIADAVARGVDAADGRRIVELDRRRAIEKAIAIARDGDVLVVAGKGHENTQTIGDRAVPFDDRVVVWEALASLAAQRAKTRALGRIGR
ncbi:MAG: UDP-N-acetylmuramoyl-L-alanyl-D-glutamate--2,6-diaminopimelate ligase [Planctomycetota bacterium]